MQATIIAAGSRGDVQPYIALGRGLKEAGHKVSFLASSDFGELVAAHGLVFFDMGGSIEAVAQAMQGQLEGGNFLRILAAMGPTAQRLATQATASGLRACERSDLIVAGLGGLFVAVALSDKLGIPIIPAYLYPFTPSRDIPAVLSPSPRMTLPPWANRLSHRMVQQMMWQTFRAADNKVRRKILGIPPLPFWGPFLSLERANRTILCGYSPHVIPAPKDWPSSIHVTGYWFLEPSTEWEPPADLTAFLESGPPPVHIGFGSMVNRRPEEVAALVLRALHLTGQRAVVSKGWGGMKARELPDTVCAIGSIPHSWLFPRTTAVVHHGGVGTTAAGLRAGVPAVVVPFFGDQPFWANRVHQMGVGPPPITRRRLTAQRLANAIDSAITDTEMRRRAAHLGERIRNENGVGRAVEVLQQVGNTIRPTTR